MSGRSAVISCINHSLGEANTHLVFMLDEANYRNEAPRRVSVRSTISGSTVKDFGFFETDRTIDIFNLRLSMSKLETLRAMHQSSNRSYDFSDGVNAWRVIIRRVAERKRGTHALVNITLQPVSKLV